MPRLVGSELTFQPARPLGFQTVALVAMAAPLMLSGCISDQNSSATYAALTPKVGEGSVDAYGYAPVSLMAFADGSRVAMPSGKPDIAKIEADPAAGAPRQRGQVDAKTEAAAKTDPEFALKADVAERKASLRQISEPTMVVASLTPPAEDKLAPGKVNRVASLATKAEPVEPKSAIGTTIAAVGQTAQIVGEKAAAVGEGAKAVAVAAIETTSRAASAVGERIGDTFSGKDTITGSAKIDRLIEEAAASNNIPSELAYAVVRVESHYNPLARGSGVYGLSQIQPRTARGLGFSGPDSALLDPETNLRYGMKYLAGAWQQGGHDVCQTAMKYKGGHRTTLMTRSAAAYCANVKRHMAAIERRRTPMNAQTILAANERQKNILVASRMTSPAIRQTTGAARPALPPTAETVAPAAAAILPVASAATSDLGRRIAAEAKAKALLERQRSLAGAQSGGGDAGADPDAEVPMPVSMLVPESAAAGRGSRLR